MTTEFEQQQAQQQPAHPLAAAIGPFVDLVSQMREAQRQFFATRDKTQKARVLIRSKNLEAKVDAELARLTGKPTP